jgi:hypothetical protein
MNTQEDIQLPCGIDLNRKLIVLIIGSTGNVGRGVLNAFQSNQAFQLAIKKNLLEIRAVFHSSKSKELIEKEYPSIKPVHLDIDQINVNDQIQLAFDGVHCLFLQTGYYTKSIIQSKTIIDYAKSVHVEFILHGGVLAQDQTINESFAYHILIEKYIEHLNLNYCHLHPAVYMQILLGYIDQPVVDLKKKQIELYWKNNYRLTWIDCNDLGKIAASILCDYKVHINQTYQLTSVQLTMDEITKIFSREFQIELNYHYQDPEDWANFTCEQILQNSQLSNREKFTRCDYIHAIKQAFIRNNQETFDEKWQIYPDLNHLLNLYQWKTKSNTLEEFIQENRKDF